MLKSFLDYFLATLSCTHLSAFCSDILGQYFTHLLTVTCSACQSHDRLNKCASELPHKHTHTVSWESLIILVVKRDQVSATFTERSGVTDISNGHAQHVSKPASLSCLLCLFQTTLSTFKDIIHWLYPSIHLPDRLSYAGTIAHTLWTI